MPFWYLILTFCLVPRVVLKSSRFYALVSLVRSTEGTTPLGSALTAISPGPSSTSKRSAKSPDYARRSPRLLSMSTRLLSRRFRSLTPDGLPMDLPQRGIAILSARIPTQILSLFTTVLSPTMQSFASFYKSVASSLRPRPIPKPLPSSLNMFTIPITTKNFPLPT